MSLNTGVINMSSWSPEELQPRRSEHWGQPTLFPMPLEAFEAAVQVSADEMRRWNRKGWLSFRPEQLAVVDWAEDVEVRFVQALARSGLSDAWVNRLLENLPEPYCYAPEKTFYSFASRSWITLPPKSEPDEDCVAEGLDAYLAESAEEEDWVTLREIRDTINGLLEQAPSDEQEQCDRT